MRLGQGRNNTKQYLAENPETAREIEAKLADAMGIELQGPSGEPGSGRGADATPIADSAAKAEESERKAA